MKLSTEAEVTLRMPFGGPGGIRAVLSRSRFEKLSAHLFRRARLAIDNAAWQVSRHCVLRR